MKVKVCFQCKVGIKVNTGDFKLEEFDQCFERWHTDHNVGILSEDELPKDFHILSLENREKAYEDLKKCFTNFD